MNPLLSDPLCYFLYPSSHLQPSDFSLIRAREALEDEDPQGPSKHLVLPGKIPPARLYRRLADSCGILVEKVEPEVLDLPSEAEIGEPNSDDVGGVAATARARRWPKYFVPPSPVPKLGTRVAVVQLWGLTHCVYPAWDRLVAMASIGFGWTTQLRMGIFDIRSLKKRDLPCHESAEVSLRCRHTHATVVLRVHLGFLKRFSSQWLRRSTPHPKAALEGKNA